MEPGGRPYFEVFDRHAMHLFAAAGGELRAGVRGVDQQVDDVAAESLSHGGDARTVRIVHRAQAVPRRTPAASPRQDLATAGLIELEVVHHAVGILARLDDV